MEKNWGVSSLFSLKICACEINVLPLQRNSKNTIMKRKREIGNQIGRFKIADLYWLDSEQLIIIFFPISGEDSWNLEISYIPNHCEIIYSKVYDDKVIQVEKDFFTHEEVRGFNTIINNHKND